MSELVLLIIIGIILGITALGVVTVLLKRMHNIFFSIISSLVVIAFTTFLFIVIRHAIHNNGFTSTDIVFQSDILTEEDTQYFISPAKSSSQVAYLDEESKVQYIDSKELKIFYDSDKPFVRKVKYWNHWYYWYELELHLEWRN